jgi:hypothetical protein
MIRLTLSEEELLFLYRSFAGHVEAGSENDGDARMLHLLSKKLLRIGYEGPLIGQRADPAWLDGMIANNAEIRRVIR